MRRRRNILVLALAMVALAAAVLWPRGLREPVYQGKRLSEWLEVANTAVDSLGQHPDYEKQDAARKAIRAIGTDALPWLISEITKPYSGWRTTFNRWADRNTQWDFRFTSDQARRSRAIDGMKILGPAVAPALPELAQWLGDSYRGRAAADAMTGAGELALPYFLQGMTSTNPATELASVSGLGNLARNTEAAVAPLIRALQSKYHWARIFAAAFLRNVPSHPELTIPSLTAALSDPHPDVRRGALQSLNQIRKTSAPLVAELRRQMQDTNPAVVLTASNALHLLLSTNVPGRSPELNRDHP